MPERDTGLFHFTFGWIDIDTVLTVLTVLSTALPCAGMAAASTASISPPALRALLDSQAELALFDTRDEQLVRAAHIFHAAYFPASWPDRRARARVLVPRLTTTVVLATGGMDEASRWTSWGYTDVRILDGGLDAWVAAGERLYRHVCCPSKALAEAAGAEYGVLSWTAEDLARAREGSNPPLVVDVRSPDEYAKASIPGAVGIPGGELVACLPLDSPQPVVVTCAFRTRGLFGATSLQWWGHTNVFFLAGGISAWLEAGYAVAPGTRPRTGGPNLDLRTHPAAASIPFINSEQLAALEQTRTVYVVDPRLDSNSTTATRHVPAGQYIEAIDEYTPVYNSVVVLSDDEPYTRAIALARWLRCSRLVEVYVLGEGVHPEHPRPRPPPTLPRPTLPPDIGLQPDYTAWSLSLPKVSLAELGGFAALTQT